MPDLSPQAKARIRQLLEKARREIAAEVASTDWERYRHPKLMAEIDHYLQQFGEEAKRALKADLNQQFAAGQLAIDQQIAGQGIQVANFPAISESALVAMQQDLADRIGGLTADAIANVQQELSLGLLGGKTPFETMAGVGRNIDAGQFSTVAARAETIVREEFGRAFRKGGQLRMEQAARHVQGLKKQWVHIGHPRVPRPTHLALHGTIKRVDEPYELLNLKTGEIEYPQFPKDPILSAENSIGCGCQSRPYKESWGLDLPKAV